MIYHHIVVQVKPGKKQEFNDIWVNESLPLWEKYGAKHIGSFFSYIGSNTNNDIVRLFAFPTLRENEEFHTMLAKDPMGQNLIGRLTEYVTSAHNQILLPANGSPLK